jgi:hypothetical protein
MNKDERILQILDRSACLNKRQMMACLKGTLFPEELRAVELHLAECDLCNDALEGFGNTKDPESLTESLLAPLLPAQEVPEKKSATAQDISQPALKPHSDKTAKNTVAEPSAYWEPALHYRKRNYLSGAVGIVSLLIIGLVVIWFFEFREKGFSGANFSGIGPTRILNKDSFPGDNPQQQVAVSPATLKEQPGAQKDTTAKTPSQAQAPDSVAGTSLAGAGQPADTVVQPVADHTVGKEAASADTGHKAKTIIKTKSDGASNATVEAKKEINSKTPDVTANAADKETFSDFETGLSLYKKKEYASALLYLQSAESSDSDPRHWDAVYYSALCNLRLGKEGRAKRYFKRVARSESSLKSAAEKQLAEMEKK